MQIDLLSEAEANAILCTPLELGLATQLLSSDSDAIAKRDEKIFGCRHCQQSRPQTSPAAATHQDVSVTRGPSQSAKDPKSGKSATIQRAAKTTSVKKLYNFNGLRSHLQEK